VEKSDIDKIQATGYNNSQRNICTQSNNIITLYLHDANGYMLIENNMNNELNKHLQLTQQQHNTGSN